MELFVYGTLVDPSLMRWLTGRVFAHEPARLHGFCRYEPPNSYPYILPSRNAVVHGSILHGIDAKTLRALDEYEGEGDLYFRQFVTAETNKGSVHCATYVGNPRAVGRLRTA